MITRQSLAAAMVVACCATACTALVMGQISDYENYPVGIPGFDKPDGESSSSSSSSSSGASSGRPDPCSLLATQSGSESPTNDCAECIATKCAEEVAYACNDGKSKKQWFSKIANCAQNPWLEDPPPSSSGSFWGCGSYDKNVGDPVPGSGDQHHVRASEICLQKECVNFKGSPCKLCDPNFDIPQTSDNALLSEDRCGKLFSEKCPQDLVDCCTSQPVDEFIRYCANTVESTNLDKCRGILEAKTDFAAFKEARLSGGGNQYGEDDFTCATKLAECFDAHQGSYQCD